MVSRLTRTSFLPNNYVPQIAGNHPNVEAHISEHKDQDLQPITTSRSISPWWCSSRTVQDRFSLSLSLSLVDYTCTVNAVQYSSTLISCVLFLHPSPSFLSVFLDFATLSLVHALSLYCGDRRQRCFSGSFLRLGRRTCFAAAKGEVNCRVTTWVSVKNRAAPTSKKNEEGNRRRARELANASTSLRVVKFSLARSWDEERKVFRCKWRD